MAYNPNNPNGQATMANSAPVTIASDQSNLPVYFAEQGVVDTFGKLMVSMSRNDIDVQFFRDNPNNILNVTTTGGGGAANPAGYAQFSTSAGTGTAKGVSLDKTHYRSGGEIYAMFTCAWLDGGQATSYQRIGLYDDTDGFFIGYENTTFGVSVENGGAITFIQRSSFNVDQLTGAVGSKFTRNGSPEAIDLTKLNIFRIRFGWLGAASVQYEVVSPDGQWVLFHVIRQPNLSDVPHIQNADLPITLDLVKTAGATNIRMNTACWGAGSQYNYPDWTESSTLGTAVNSVVNYNILGLGGISVFVNTTQTGTFTFEATIDGKTWFTHPLIVGPSLSGEYSIIATDITPTSGNYYKMSASGYKGIRARTTATLGGGVTLGFVGDTLESFTNMLPPPHTIGYALVHKDSEYTTQQTGSTFWQPASGKKFVVTDFTISTGGTTSGILTMWQGALADTTYNAGTDPAIFRGEFAPSNTSKPGITKTFNVPYVSTTVNHCIKISTSTAMTMYIQVNGYEI
jgi:hypothetical protein